MVTFGPWAAGEFVRSRRRLAAEQLHDTVAHWLTAVVIPARADEEITRAATLLGRDGISPDSLLELAGHLVDAVPNGPRLMAASCPPGPCRAEAGG